MGILDSLISAVVSPGSGHAITGGLGLLLGTGFGAYLHSLKANCEKKNLVLTLEHLPKTHAEILNENCREIIESMLQELDALDKGCELQLQLGSTLHEHIDTFCYLRQRHGSEFFHIPKLHEGVKSLDLNQSSAYAIEKTINEYFETYLNVNRQVINSENRAAAVAAVQIMRNTSIILVQMMKSLASLPGYENELRLLKLKEIMKNFYTNILHNKLLTGNFNKNLHEYLITTTKQRETLALRVQRHYDQLIDQLILEQRDISIQQLAQQSSIQLHGLTSAFLELIARLFDSQAGKEFTEITTYKMAQGMLRADTAQATGALPFPDKGIYTLLKPFAVIAENLNQLSHQEDLLSFVQYQDIFTEPALLKAIGNWNQKYHYLTLTAEEQQLLAEDLAMICKLLFVCQALEKDFFQSAVNYGHRGLLGRGEYHAKRFIISFFYEAALQRVEHFFTRHPAFTALLQHINDPKWLEAQGIPITGHGQSFVIKTETASDKSLIKQNKVVTNSVFRRCIQMLNTLRVRMDYIHNAFLDRHYLDAPADLSVEPVLTPENRVYQFNVVRLLEEFGLVDSLGINLSSKTPPNPSIDKNLLTALQLTYFQIQQAEKLLLELSGKLRLRTVYNPTRLSPSYQLQFEDKLVEIDAPLYEYLRGINNVHFRWVDVPQNRLLNLVTQEQEFHFNETKGGNLAAYVGLYQHLNRLYDLTKQHVASQTNEAIEAFLSRLHDVLANRQVVIEHVTLESENLKQLAANNIRLKSEYTKNQQQIEALSQDVRVLHAQLDNTRSTIEQLKQNTAANLAYIEKIEAINGDIYTLLLDEFKDNIHDLNEINQDLNGKLDEIQQLLRGQQSSQVQLASEEIYTLKQNMRTRIDIILQRFNRYEKSFECANDEIRKAFSRLKSNISQEKLIIDKLESQLNLALRQLEEQRQKAQFFTAKQGQVKVIVSDFKTLFAHLETTFQPRLHFFSSYRGIKTRNLMTFIEILLANQRPLKANIDSYRSKMDFNRTIEELLNQSQVINCYHGVFNNSVSKKVFKDIIEQFQRGTLVQTLKTQGIAYHDANIKLSYDGELVYKNERIPCPVQP